jgi:glycosyltransferase involved in cell wall biosynthesis
MAARILIVTPRHLSANPRVVKEAIALAEAGYEVSILRGDYDPAFRMEDAALLPGVFVQGVSFGPQARLMTYLRQSAVRRTAYAAFGAGVHKLGVALRAHDPVAADLSLAAERIPADLYIAHYDAALPAVRRAARHHGAIYAFDAEDYHLGDLSDEPLNARSKAIIAAVEQATLPGAAYITAASPGIADAYAARYGVARPTVIRNVFPIEQAPTAATPRGSVNGPSLYWFSQTIGCDRGLETAITAISLAACRPHLYLRGRPSLGYSDRLLELAFELGVADRLHFLPIAPPSAMVGLAAAYDAGFVGETGSTENRRIALTNKQFTYLLGGIPVVMSDVPAHISFATEADGAAFLYRKDDPWDLAAKLDGLIGVPAGLAAARARAYELGQTRYNWEMEKRALLDIVSKALASPFSGAHNML